LLSRFLGEPKRVHVDRLIDFAVAVVRPVVPEDEDPAVIGLKATWIVARPIHATETGDRKFRPMLTGVGGPVDPGGGDVQHDPLARGQQFRMAGMPEGGRPELLESPALAVAPKQSLPARFPRAIF